MIELTAKLVSGPVYLAGETLECCIKLTHTSQPEHKISQSHSDIMESLAWASAQLVCFFSTTKPKPDKVATSKSTALEVSSCDSGDVILQTKPTILFCDLTVPIGETKIFTYRETIPIEAPPSYRGHAIKYSYKVTVATQKVGSHIKMVRLPFRVMPLSSIVKMHDFAALIGNETTEELQPTNPFSEARKAETPLSVSLQVLQNLTARRSPNSYMITNTHGRVARFCLFKSAYKLGEDIVGTFDFSVGTVRCMQVLVSLQPEEELKSQSPTQTAKPNTPSSRTLSVASFHEVTIGLLQSYLMLPIPLHITPAFETNEVCLKWRLHFEFVTTNIEMDPKPEDEEWRAPLDVPIETMVWNLPISIYSTLPKHISHHLIAESEYTIHIR